jgi:hypothetical protein
MREVELAVAIYDDLHLISYGFSHRSQTIYIYRYVLSAICGYCLILEGVVPAFSHRL